MTAIASNTAALADEFGSLDAQIKQLEERKAALRAHLEAALGDGDAIIGSRFTVARRDVLSARLDTKALRKALGDALDKFENASVSTRITVKPTAALDLVA